MQDLEDDNMDDNMDYNDIVEKEASKRKLDKSHQESGDKQRSRTHRETKRTKHSKDKGK